MKPCVTSHLHEDVSTAPDCSQKVWCVCWGAAVVVSRPLEVSWAERGALLVAACDTLYWVSSTHTHTRACICMYYFQTFLHPFCSQLSLWLFSSFWLFWCHWCFHIPFFFVFRIVKSLMHCLWTCGSPHHKHSQMYSSVPDPLVRLSSSPSSLPFSSSNLSFGSSSFFLFFFGCVHSERPLAPTGPFMNLEHSWNAPFVNSERSTCGACWIKRSSNLKPDCNVT